MTNVQRLKYRLACWLIGYDINAAQAIARRHGYIQGFSQGLMKAKG